MQKKRQPKERLWWQNQVSTNFPLQNVQNTLPARFLLSFSMTLPWQMRLHRTYPLSLTRNTFHRQRHVEWPVSRPRFSVRLEEIILPQQTFPLPHQPQGPP